MARRPCTARTSGCGYPHSVIRSSLLLAACRGGLADWHSGVGQLDSLGPDDHVALLQHDVRPQRRQAGKAAVGNLARFRRDLHLQDPVPDSGADSVNWTIYCAAYPDFCKEPFNCQTYSEKEDRMYKTVGYAPGGVPSYRTWCMQPNYASYMSRCASGKLKEAGRIQFALTEAGMFGGLCREADGSYCFLEGHCANDEVSENTTLEEAVEMCDKRFGREAWSRFGAADAPEDSRPGYGSEEARDPRNGFDSVRQTRPFLLAACAMANYHCDVVYCKETYCKDPYYVQKYGHYLKENGWVK